MIVPFDIIGNAMVCARLSTKLVLWEKAVPTYSYIPMFLPVDNRSSRQYGRSTVLCRFLATSFSRSSVNKAASQHSRV